ncbi:cAMP-binding domain of CRP or a regulatory subunit of cAMP-dependent protein kinases [Chitinophaga eiseniae]|uniref:cAMP-binding domain of CRP or a regulatory subunit of cAMP-dependent protein kinases n=1 Tax=Chitinophaga eiseniae TaxID=634771 RepID=A0A1T4KBC2_9BACT|nr:Crp/Fnr family transcriptional regulator [Chitinophaga eiseniae]SJZ39633.1 cAMP-binding domain of CRP or a regulatory subunit of cAMP-dependent protein kinases [Chitinophaga eiseniae]
MTDLQSFQQAIYKFYPLTTAEWDDFSSKLITKKCRKGDFLTREGQVENFIYFLHTGATRNYFIRDGKEFTVDFQFEGDMVTAYYSLITREPSTVFIELLEDASIVAIPFRFLQEFYNKHHHGERIGRLIAEYQYAKRLRKEMELLSLTAEERYVQLLERNPALVQQISVKHLSSFLGIQPESLSRIRKQHARN